MIFEPRSAIRLVTRANASRPLSVNSIVTTGWFVCGSRGRLGVLDVRAVQLGVVLEHEEALDLRRLVLDALGLDDRDALGHLDHPRAGGRAARSPSAFSSSAQAVPLAYSGASPGCGVEVGEHLLAACCPGRSRRCGAACLSGPIGISSGPKR